MKLVFRQYIRRKRRGIQPEEIEKEMHWDTTAKYEFLLKVTNAVVTQTNREDMFAALARELKKKFAYDRLSIYMFVPGHRGASCTLPRPPGVVPRGMADPSGRPLDKASIAREVIKSRSPVYLEDLAKYPAFLHRTGNAKSRA